MKAWHRPLVALGLLAPACSPGQPQPAHKAGTGTTAPLHPLIPADEATTTTEAATTTTQPLVAAVVTIEGLPARSGRGTTTTTFAVPEAVEEETDEEYWRNQPGYSGVWPALAECESGNRNVDTGNGYSGYFQFSDATWRSMGTGYARAVDAPYAVQLDAAQRLQARSGWGQWPACSRKLGLR